MEHETIKALQDEMLKNIDLEIIGLGITLDGSPVMEIGQALSQVICYNELELKRIEAEQKALKQRLCDFMTEHKIQKVENDLLVINYFPADTKTGLDSEKLKTEHEEVYLQCLKQSQVKAFIKIKVK